MNNMYVLKYGAVVVAVCALFAAQSCRHTDLVITSEVWDVDTSDGDPYYLNNNFSTNGNPLVGLINKVTTGPREYNSSDGSLLHYCNVYTNGTPAYGSKSVLHLSNYIFFTGAGSRGIMRIDGDWNTNSVTTFADPGGTGPESIATDGTHIFANNDVAQSNIHAYSVVNNPTDFTLTEEWVAHLPGTNTANRIRGLSYWGGYLYTSMGGNTAGDRSIYAVDANNGAITDTRIDVPGAAKVYSVIRRGKLLMALTLDNLYVWDMTSATGVNTNTLDTYTKADLANDIIMFGISYDGANLYIGSDLFHVRALAATQAVEVVGMTLSLTNLTQTVNEGQNTANQSFAVSKTWMVGPVNYTIETNVSWISVTPGSGVTTGEQDQITVSYSTTGLARGIHTGEISVVTRDNGGLILDGSAYTQRVEVVMTVEHPLPLPTPLTHPK